MNKLIPACFILLFATLVSCNSPKQLISDKDWVFLGEKKVNHLRESDIIKIKSREKFTALRLYVQDKAVDIQYVEVTLISGDVLKPVIETNIQAGEQSRIIDLGIEGRQLDQVKIRYRAVGKIFSKKALVQVGGKRL